jgi:hypothetical protein
MNDDYLWDKSGEPDPEIQELEEILKPLRYQPTPLELPREVRRRNYLPLAIAATILIALLISGIWLRLRRETAVVPPLQQASSSEPSVFKEETPTPEVVLRNTDLQKQSVPKRSNRRIFTKQEREEALAAKEQVMLALRLASEKLKLAQRRTQGPLPNQIKNQHRVG